MGFDFTKHKDELLFVPLGGSNEIGMNLNLYGYKGSWLMVDLGIGFANDYLPGVEVLTPDIAFLEDKLDNLVGLVLTHAHEDHLGAVPYLWEDIECPIYATPFTASVLKNKLAREKMDPPAPIHEVEPGSSLQLGPFALELISLTHSIPEMQAVAINTDKGTVLHTGDWKLDPDPLIGPTTDEKRLIEYGDNGVMAIVCDSTNVFVEGDSGSESDVREELVQLISQCSNRVVVTTFASNLARLESIIKAAQEAKRKIVVAGRSIEKMIQAAKDSGYLQDAPEVYSDKEAMDIPREECLIICTGCQGEPRAALTKISRGEHPKIRLSPQDSVIFSSREIPGNESRIGYVHNLLVQQDVEVLSASKHAIHVSGHPARDELARMYQMVKPQIAVPVHGEARHIHEHAKLAKSFQVPETVEATNGAIIRLEKGKAAQIGTVESGYYAVDGKSLLPTSSKLFSRRRRMRDEGIIFISFAMEGKNLVGDPILQAPGCLDPEVDADLIEEIQQRIIDTVEGHKKGNLEQAIRQSIRKLLKRELGKYPLIEFAVIQV
jgi:ribonuclease J